MSLLLFAFVAALFVLMGIDLKWRPKSLVLLVLLIIASGAFGTFMVFGVSTFVMGAVMNGMGGLPGMPEAIELDSASSVAGFDVYAPGYLPANLRLNNVQLLNNAPLMPGTSYGDKGVMLEYSGGGEDLFIFENRRGSSMFGSPFGPFPPGGTSFDMGANNSATQREKVKIKDQTGSLVTAGGMSALSFEIGDTAIEISSTLPKDELLKLAESFEKK